jgi:CheY-like chemotaxis protein/HPt (histidine-containing phosphotransfer) domain-containing protein
MAGQTAYDVILMDISMPVMDGVTATRNIRQGGGLSQNVPIFAVTAHALPEEIVTFKKAGMDDYVSKPIERRVLLEKLRRISKNVKRIVLKDVENKVNVMENSTVLDVERINEMRRDLGADVLGMLLGRFMQEAEQAMAGYLDDDAVRQREISEVIAEMHKIAGSAAALGAMEFRRRLNEIEVLGKEGNTQAVYDSIPSLNDLWLASKSELELLTAA